MKHWWSDAAKSHHFTLLAFHFELQVEEEVSVQKRSSNKILCSIPMQKIWNKSSHLPLLLSNVINSLILFCFFLSFLSFFSLSLFSLSFFLFLSFFASFSRSPHFSSFATICFPTHAHPSLVCDERRCNWTSQYQASKRYWPWIQFAHKAANQRSSSALKACPTNCFWLCFFFDPKKCVLTRTFYHYKIYFQFKFEINAKLN